MLSTLRLNPDLRANYLADVTANVLWVMLFTALNSFGLVVALNAGANTLFIALAYVVIYLPGITAGLLPAICRRLPLGRTMLIGRVAGSLCLLPCALAPSLLTFAVGYVGLYLIGVTTDAAYPSLFNRIYPPELHARAMGLIFTKRALAMFLISLLLGRVMKGMDETSCLRIIGWLLVLGLLSAAAMWRFRNVREDQAGETADVQARDVKPLQNREFVRYLVALTFFGSGGILGSIAWPILQADGAFALSYPQVGALAAVASISQMLAYFGFSRYGVVHPSNRQLVAPYALTAAHMVACLGLLLFAGKGITLFTVLLISMVVANAGAGLQQVYFFLVVNAMAGPSATLAYQTVQNVVVGIRGVIVPLLGGVILARFGLLPTVAAAALLMLTGMPFWRIWYYYGIRSQPPSWYRVDFL